MKMKIFILKIIGFKDIANRWKLKLHCSIVKKEQAMQ